AVLMAHTLPRYAALPLTALAKNAIILVPAQAVAYLLLIAFAHLLMIARHDRALTEAIPFTWPREHWVALVATGAALAMLILLLGRFLPIPKELPIDEFFKTRSSAFVMLVFAILVAPI